MQLQQVLSSEAPCTPISSFHRVAIYGSRAKRSHLVLRAGVQTPETTTASAARSTDKEKPDWTGDSVLSSIVNAAIGFPPLFNVMKLGARAAMKDTATRQGVPWDQTIAGLEASEVFRIREEMENKSIEYPSYYTQPFHGYELGNLNWQAAFEVEPATQVMALRVWKDETSLSPLAAQQRLRSSIYGAIDDFRRRHGLRDPLEILDVGCSTGVSTRWLAESYQDAHVTGLDLSPHFLAVAELRERQFESGKPGGVPAIGGTMTASQRQRIVYRHGNMESTGLPDDSCDMVIAQFVIHECPAKVIENLVAECKRLVRPGGVVALADNNPRSKVIQGLPPVLFTLMKSTEPWSDEYYAFDVEAAMTAAGLNGAVTEESDPWHRVVLSYLPK